MAPQTLHFNKEGFQLTRLFLGLRPPVRVLQGPFLSLKVVVLVARIFIFGIGAVAVCRWQLLCGGGSDASSRSRRWRSSTLHHHDCWLLVTVSPTKNANTRNNTANENHNRNHNDCNQRSPGYGDAGVQNVGKIFKHSALGFTRQVGKAKAIGVLELSLASSESIQVSAASTHRIQSIGWDAVVATIAASDAFLTGRLGETDRGEQADEEDKEGGSLEEMHGFRLFDFFLGAVVFLIVRGV